MNRNHYQIIAQKFAKCIKEIRERKNISIQELSQKTGINAGYISKIESAQAKRVKVSHIFLLADGLQVSPSEIIKEL